MTQRMKDRLFANWHLMRWIALAVALFFIVQAFRYQDLLSGLVGGFFLFQAVTNTGCLCGNCAVPESPSAQTTGSNGKEVEFTEINED